MAIHLPIALTKQELKNIIQDLADRNKLSISGMRLTLTGGYAADGYSVSTPNLVITQNVFTPHKSSPAKGLNLITKNHQCQLPHVKTIDYLMPISLQSELKKAGADDVVYTSEGLITECPRANIFIATKDGRLVTPFREYFVWHNKKKILAIARPNYRIEERSVTIKDLQNAAEIFITSTTKGLLPVRQVDDFTSGTSGKVSAQLSEELTTLFQQE